MVSSSDDHSLCHSSLIIQLNVNKRTPKPLLSKRKNAKKKQHKNAGKISTYSHTPPPPTIPKNIEFYYAINKLYNRFVRVLYAFIYATRSALISELYIWHFISLLIITGDLYLHGVGARDRLSLFPSFSFSLSFYLVPVSGCAIFCLCIKYRIHWWYMCVYIGWVRERKTSDKRE